MLNLFHAIGHQKQAGLKVAVDTKRIIAIAHGLLRAQKTGSSLIRQVKLILPIRSN